MPGLKITRSYIFFIGKLLEEIICQNKEVNQERNMMSRIQEAQHRKEIKRIHRTITA